MMPQLFEAELILPPGERGVQSMGSLFHGALMERLPEGLAAFLHTQNLRPYSQCIYRGRDTGSTLWRIGTLDGAMGQAVQDALCGMDELFLKQKNYAVSVRHVRCVRQCSYTELADECFLSAQAPQGARLSFLSPTSFKRDGAYVLLPELLLIVQSLLVRWNRFSKDVRIEEEGLAQKLAAACRLTRYALHTAPFSLEGYTMYGFRGQMSLRFAGTDMVRRILGTLAAFAPYAGIGIKTALGMGAVDVDIWKGQE